MKKSIALFVIVVVASHASAQTLDSIGHHSLGPYSAQTSTFMEMSDGSILDGVLLADEYPTFSPQGYVLHKVSRVDPGLAVVDTLFVPYEFLPWHLTVKDPDGDGNILAEIANDPVDDHGYLRIRRFDDDLDFDTAEIVVHLEQYPVKCGDPGLLLDTNGDLVVSYYYYYSDPLTYTFARIGLDGTVKQKVTNDTLNISRGNIRGPIVFSEEPLRYCWWGSYYTQSVYYLNLYVLDSQFNITATYTLPRSDNELGHYVEYDNDGFVSKCLGMEEGGFMVARPYNRPYNLNPHIEDDGVAVIRYNADLNLLAIRKFLSEPYFQISKYFARPIGLGRSGDGNVFFAYFTNQRQKESRISVVKMDNDLNIIWQRYCLENRLGRDFGRMVVLDDNSVAIVGINILEDYSETFYLIVNDDYDGIEEQGVIVRPYAYYPNPTQNELHLQYSPDVTPKQIELYDLQGRLVKTQRTGLESLNLQGLASGTYTMRVTLEGGKVFSDKVVKE